MLTYASTASENAEAVLKSVRGELEKFLDSGLRRHELEMFKTQVKGQILLGAEDMENRMSSLGVNEMTFGQYRPVDEVIGEIEKVSTRSVRDYVRKYFDKNKASLMVMGDLEPREALKLMEIWG
jgi:predicted Zn-dependent peptidase